MEHPGIVVLHEANLHHLIADLTIRRGDWDAYLREVEINAGEEARAFAERHVKTLEMGPDYDIPMLKPVLARSRGAIVHSAAVENELRAPGLRGAGGEDSAWSLARGCGSHRISRAIRVERANAADRDFRFSEAV